jgi:hypothetical protein
MPGNGDDLPTVQAERAGELPGAPKFASLVISAAAFTGCVGADCPSENLFVPGPEHRNPFRYG